MRVSVVVVLACGLPACSFEGGGANEPLIDAAPDVPAIDAAAPTADAALVPVLIDRSLVVRYFIDEASSGQAPTELVDSAADPLNIPITYGQAVYVENNGNRGLNWQTPLGDGKVEIGVGSPKLSDSLRVLTTTTMELVVDVDDADSATPGHIAGLRGSNPDFIISAVGDSELQLHRPFNALTATWTNVDNRDRMVLHIVYDATQPDPEDRVTLYKNGVVMPKTTSTPPPMGESVTLSTNVDFLIGNHQDENQSFGGTVYYLAYYDETLTPTEVDNNARRLLANDDQ